MSQNNYYTRFHVDKGYLRKKYLIFLYKYVCWLDTRFLFETDFCEVFVVMITYYNQQNTYDL